MNMFHAFQELDKISEDVLKRGNTGAVFANNIDKDIIDVLHHEIPNEPVTDINVKCSKSATANALYYVAHGENVKFSLGTIKLPLKQIAHCWIEHNGKILQTRNSRPDSELITKFSVDLIPNDVESSKKLIYDLVTSINNGTAK